MSSVQTTSTNGSYLYHALSLRGDTTTTISGAAPIEQFHLYKALREEELQALRSLVRVFAMHGAGASMPPKLQNRMLEDLCDAMDIPRETLEAERALAAADVNVRMISDTCRVSDLRAMHHDATNDISLGSWLSVGAKDTEDDGATLWKRASAGASGSGGGHPGKTSARGAATSKAPAKTVANSKYVSEIQKLHKDVEGLVHKYVATPEGRERSDLKALLEAKKKELVAIRDRLDQEDSGAATPL